MLIYDALDILTGSYRKPARPAGTGVMVSNISVSSFSCGNSRRQGVAFRRLLDPVRLV